MLFSNSQIHGISTELLVAQKLVEYGFMVSFPFGNNSRYDLIVDTNKALYRVQVKYARKMENGSYTIDTSNTVATRKKIERKYYTKNDVDFIISVIEDRLVVIPIEDVEGSASKVYRTELPQKGTKSACNLISDYTVEKYFL